MPRTPEVCPTAFCPLSQLSNTVSSSSPIPLSASHRLPPDSHQLPPVFRRLPSAVCLLPSAFCLLLFLVTHHSSLITVRAQGATATLSGSVVDANGAVIPGVNVAVINLSQGFQRTTTTNSEGIFVVPLLPPATYTVKAEHQGFTTAEVRDVILNVNDQVRLTIPLKVGSITGQSVDIVDTPPLINESPAVGTVVDRQFVGNLPLNGRSFNTLIALTPGIVQAKASANTPGQFSINGQRTNANYFMVDGVSANVAVTASVNLGQTLGGSLPSLTALGGTNNLASVDAVQEFKVLTSSYAPEFGRTPGGQISIVTRSGTNEFHGTLFDYLRNDVFDATDWFVNANRLRKPPLRQNDFGGVFGGPIIIPLLYNGHNRTFFFFSYEGLRLRQPKVVSNAEVPSISLRLTSLPQIQPYLNAFPVPNGADLGNGLALFSASYSAPSTINATSIRIDHTFNKKLTMFGRFNDAPSQTLTRGTASLSSPLTTFLDTRTLTVGATVLVNTKITNEFRANYSRTQGGSSLVLDSFGGAVPIPASQLFPSFASPENSLFNFTVGFSTRPTLLSGSNAESFQRQVNLVDVLSVANGSHQLKFGIDYRRLTPVYGPTNYSQQSTFNNATAIRTATTSGTFIVVNKTARPLFKNFSAFAQDTWRASPRLILTYGFRWDVNPPPRGADGNDAYTVTGADNPANITLAPLGTPLFKTRYTNFAPRVGLAFHLSQRQNRELVFRGGAGVFYDLGTGQSALGFTGASFFAFRSCPSAACPIPPSFPLTGPDAAPPAFPTPPFINGVLAFDPNLQPPRTYQWNMALEQSLGGNQTISATYVGALGRQLNSLDRLLNPNPRFTSVNVVKNEATSDYHAAQLQFQRRLSRGLQTLISYTWSHSIDKVSSDFGIGLDRGSSDFDVRHSFAAAVTYNFPKPALGDVANAVLRDWSLDGIVRSRSATPVDLVARTSQNLSGESLTVRPDLVSGVPIYLNDPAAPGGKRFNPAAFLVPPIGRQGTLGRNVLRGFPLNQTDLSLRRQFNLTERVHLQSRIDLFNIFNHPNFADPINTVTSVATFGRSQQMFGAGLGTGGVSGGFNTLYQVGGPRSMQLSLKLQF